MRANREHALMACMELWGSLVWQVSVGTEDQAYALSLFNKAMVLGSMDRLDEVLLGLAVLMGHAFLCAMPGFADHSWAMPAGGANISAICRDLR